MPTVRAYGATSATEPLVPMTIELRELQPSDVLIDIKYAGICHSDIHTVRGEWRPITYPQVVGHEITGIVAAVGSDVTKHKVGDRVGVGCMVNSCGTCEMCLDGDEQFCREGSVMTYAGKDRDGSITQGGYAQQVVVVEDFVLKIPDALALDAAAPLLCAGITTYSPLKHWNAGPGTRVGIIGMGGLGHMGVQFAHALGCDVTVLSHSLSKRDDGLALGADHYYATSDPQTFKDLRRSLDLIVNTVSAPLPMASYLELMERGGSLVNVGLPPEPVPIPAFSLMRRVSYSGSSIGGIAETQEMLDFCAEHGIAAKIELISADQINDAYKRVVESDVRYRFVIDVATI